MTNVALDTMIDKIIDTLGSNKVGELVSAIQTAEEKVKAVKAESEANEVGVVVDGMINKWCC